MQEAKEIFTTKKCDNMYKHEQMRNNIVFKQPSESPFCQIVLYIGSQRIEIMAPDMLKLMHK